MSTRAITVPGVRLREALPGGEVVGAADVVVTGCTADVSQVRPGDACVVMPEWNGDAEALETAVAARGGIALIADRPLKTGRLPVCYVPHVREALGRLCQALAGHPSKQLRTIGIAGTHGKTITSYLIASLLCEGNCASALIGASGYFDGVHWAEPVSTTAPAPLVAEWLRRAAANGCSHALVEASRTALAEYRLAGIELDAVCITTSRSESTQAPSPASRANPAWLLEQLAPEGVAVLNADDDHCEHYLRLLDGPVLTVGIDQAAEITATPLEQSSSEQTYLLSAGSMSLPVRTRLIGRHNIYNTLSAAAVGLAYGLDLPEIVRGIEQIESVPGRLERIECGQRFGVYIDNAGTADALTTCLDTLREVTSGRVIGVFTVPSDVDRLSRAKIGRAIEYGADVGIVTTNGIDEPSHLIREVTTGYTQSDRARIIPDRAEAIAWALDLAEAGDSVLIAGQRRKPNLTSENSAWVDDRDVAREWLFQSHARTQRRRAA